MNDELNTIEGDINLGEELDGEIGNAEELEGEVSLPNTIYENDYNNLIHQPVKDGVRIIGQQTNEDLHISATKTTAEWDELTDLVSVRGETYVYSDGGGIDAEENPIPAVKVGDGETLVVDLPFIVDPSVPEWAKQQEKPTYTYDEVGAVGAENELHITEIDRMFQTVFGS